MVPAELLTIQTLLQTNRYLGSSRNQLYRDNLTPDAAVLVDYILENELHEIGHAPFPNAHRWYAKLRNGAVPIDGSTLLGILALLEHHLP